MMQAQISNRMLTATPPRPALDWRKLGVIGLVAVVTIAANWLMAMGWSHLLGGAWLDEAQAGIRLVWMLGFGTLMASNNALALLVVWGWARRNAADTEMRQLVRWARRERRPLARHLPTLALSVAVMFGPALLLLV